MANADYLTAVETKLRWERMMKPGATVMWPQGTWQRASNGEVVSGREQVAIESTLYASVLKHAEIVYVSPKFCSVLDTVVPSMPDMTLTPSWIPSPYGFIYFGREITLPNLTMAAGHRDARLKIRAMGWVAGKAHTPGPGMTVGDMDQVNIIEVLLFQERAEGFYPLSFFWWRAGESLFSRIIEYENEASKGESYEQWETHEMKYFCALLNLMHDRIFRSVPTRVHYDRSARRRLEKANLVPIPEIKVVTLRRYLYRDKQTGVVKLIEWDHQWPVRGHWRQQWYPSEQAYRPKFVMPYIKGPQDKPFKDPTGRLFAVVR
jgi:hypothetical protein